MDSADQLAQLDQRFVDIYEAARGLQVERQKERALIVMQDDDVLLYRHDRAMERFTGLRPPLYDKMKTVGHLPLGVYCLLHDQADRPLEEARLAQLEDYRAAIEAARCAGHARAGEGRHFARAKPGLRQGDGVSRHGRPRRHRL